jgi:SAM-dependent methyltransferase
MSPRRSAEELAALMASADHDADSQLRQTRFRVDLVRGWDVPDGARVLEIGCGQGDTTAVLADAVGAAGRVTAVDIAGPDYGAPATIGESTGRLAEGPLARRIEFRLAFDALDPANGFADDAFDVVVLAHCTWYFASLETLADMLRRIRPWAPRLCLSEWELQPDGIDQCGHLLAVLIQGQIESFKTETIANVRTPYSRETLHALLRETGWAIAAETTVDASELEDGRWEIEECLDVSRGEAEALDLPLRAKQLLGCQLDVLQQMYERGETRSLPAYSVVAERLSSRSEPAPSP